MASPYTAGALEARDIAEMGGVNTADVNSAATAFGVIADDTGELMVGVIALTTTSVVLANSMTIAPDFIFTSVNSIETQGVIVSATTTTITFTAVTTNTCNIYYILGATA